MTTTLMILQAVVSVLLIIVVLLQFGKGAEAGLMGGSSESAFTGAQQANIFSRLTIVLSVIFLANSVLLAKIQGEKSSSSMLESEALSTNPLRAPKEDEKKDEDAANKDKKAAEPAKKSQSEQNQESREK